MLMIVSILLGIGLLVAGRRLFWLFVAAAGFVAGVQFALQRFEGPEWMVLVVGLAVGVLFALLAIFLRAVAIYVAGFLAGGSILLSLAAIFGLDSSAFSWVLYIVGGIIGVILVSMLFDWALIILSSLAGAALIVQNVEIASAIGGLAFLILVVVGVVIQAAGMRKDKADG
jgi:hypothetical protein